VTLKALELGAVDFVAKPRAENITLLQDYAEDIRDKIRAAKGALLKSRPVRASATAPTRPEMTPTPGGLSTRLLNERVIAIGASTGGTEAIKDVLVGFPAAMPPILMVQHMPETFTPSFARRLDSLCQLTVIEAQGGERLQPGMAYLAPGHSHMTIRRSGTGYITELNRNEPVNRHRPAVDVLFDSVAEQVRGNALGVILTGMGKDGAQGLLRMRNAGAWTVGQDQASCVVYGMPREAAIVGAVEEVASLDAIPGKILGKLRQLDR
jgi:two-component system chemotaxis response regulator CheB